MNDQPPVLTVLTLNAGSSSIRFAMYVIDQHQASETKLMSGKVERIGLAGTTFSVQDQSGAPMHLQAIHELNFIAVANIVLVWLEAQPLFSIVQAVGHRVVHGLLRKIPERVTPQLLSELKNIMPFAPLHLPSELALMTAIQNRYPTLLQVACFDTAFHTSMPRVAQLLPIPRRYIEQGVQRYGFHGLSYEYLLKALAQLGDDTAKKGRVILAHLGNGASMAAVRDGKSIDSSMSFTPASGLMMSSRTGDLDPGLISFMAQSEQMTIPQFEHMVNHQSGLLGISQTSADLRDLLEIENTDERAAEAIALFCYQAKKCIGAFAAVLGGIDTIVFTGGIGENAPLIRQRICAQLEFFGIELSVTNNTHNAEIISSAASPVMVRVIHTDEELMIAWSVAGVMALDALCE